MHIDPEFQSFLPEVPLSKEFVKDLVENGIRDPITTYHDAIVDGHRRFQVATEHNLPFSTVNIDHLPSREAVFKWMFENQDSRRNWRSAHDRALTLGKLSDTLKRSGVSKAVAATAEMAGTSGRTVLRARKYTTQFQSLPEEVQEAIKQEPVARAVVQEIADMSEDEQKAIAQNVKAGTASSVKDAIRTAKGYTKSPKTKTSNPWSVVMEAMKKLKKALLQLGNTFPGPAYDNAKRHLDRAEDVICAWRDAE